MPFPFKSLIISRPRTFNVLGLSKRAEYNAKHKRNLTWPQVRVMYPRINPFDDADKDKVPNWLDCRPFNIKRQDTPPPQQIIDIPENLLADRMKEEAMRRKIVEQQNAMSKKQQQQRRPVTKSNLYIPNW